MNVSRSLNVTWPGFLPKFGASSKGQKAPSSLCHQCTFLCDKPDPPWGEAGWLACPHTESPGLTKESSPSRTPPGHSLCCCCHTVRPRPELEPRWCSSRTRRSFLVSRDHLTHCGPGEGGSGRPQPCCRLRPHDGDVGPASEPPLLQPRARAHGRLRAGKSGFLSWFPQTAGLRAWEGGSHVASSVLEAPLRLISYSSVTHQLPISCPSVTDHFQGTGNHLQGRW